jgi:methyltransferase family protein/glycosyl transferase family 2
MSSTDERRPDPSTPVPDDEGRIETALISIVRNEMDLLPAWLGHTRALIDHCYIVDHLSQDGTHEYLKDYAAVDSSVRLYTFREQVYDRERIIRTLRARVIEETDAEWMFILDPDEFLPYSNRSEFEAALQSAEHHGVVRYRWRNCLPEAPGPITGDFDCYRQVRVSRLGKVAIRREIATDRRIHIPRGAHAVRHETDGLLSALDIGELYHIPFRSLEQAWEKVLRGTINRLRILTNDPKSWNNWHYPELVNLLTARPEWPTALQLVYDYGEQDDRRRVRATLTADQLREEFERCSFSLAGLPAASALRDDASDLRARTLPIDVLARNPYHRSLMEEVMILNSDSRVPLGGQLSVAEDGELVHPADFSSRVFSPSDDGSPITIDFDGVVAALQAAFWEIEYPVSPSWGSHVPFMFSLVSLLQPRTFVELGVQSGASFFAACQAVRRLGIDTTCVAVDNWVGDQHAGVSVAGEFEAVRTRISEHYGDFAGYIRANFDDAGKNFESGSIDLLHIDGFHTASAVTHDFDTWADKLSDRGVALFHDINEFKSDFGVWRFWRRAKQAYPSIEFGHGHGLGVLLVGEKCPLRSGDGSWAQSLLSADGAEVLQVLYGGVGRLSWEQARLNRLNKAAAATSTSGAPAAQVARLNRRVKELDSVRARLDRRVKDLESSTSWRVTAPIRAIGRTVRTFRKS